MLVNLSVVATIGYQQVAKFDDRVRVIATTWDAETLLVDCETGDQARAVIRLLAQGLRQGSAFIDLNQINLDQLTAATESSDQGVL
jgi:hypothetical protein